MNGTTFKIAMANQLALARYEQPAVRFRNVKEWLIVSRWGGNGEFVSISNAGGMSEFPDEAPADIAANNTMFGLLQSEDADAQETVFLLVRHLPSGISVEGTFFPADGYARIDASSGTAVLRAGGRHARTQGRREGDLAFHDIPSPAPSTEGPIAWHFDGVRAPWPGEQSGAPAV